jgi:hypothetical protein
MKFLVGKARKLAKYRRDVSETDFGSELTHPDTRTHSANVSVLDLGNPILNRIGCNV